MPHQDINIDAPDKHTHIDLHNHSGALLRDIVHGRGGEVSEARGTTGGTMRQQASAHAVGKARGSTKGCFTSLRSRDEPSDLRGTSAETQTWRRRRRHGAQQRVHPGGVSRRWGAGARGGRPWRAVQARNTRGRHGGRPCHDHTVQRRSQRSAPGRAARGGQGPCGCAAREFRPGPRQGRGSR